MMRNESEREGRSIRSKRLTDQYQKRLSDVPCRSPVVRDTQIFIDFSRSRCERPFYTPIA